VEALDRVFTNVCELDLVFKPDQVAQILQEIITVLNHRNNLSREAWF
jgi:hypothetical protein